MQEYIKYSIDLGFFNSKNIERVVERLENLYKMLGYIGNIYFAENARVGHFDVGTLSQDHDYSARDPKKIVSINDRIE